MKIEIWSDYVCPFCYMGKRKLEEALDSFPQKDQIDIEFKSFQLDPNTPSYSDSGPGFYEGTAAKYGGTVEQVKQMMAGIVEQAKSVGLDFRFETMKPTNTFDAHRLTKFAREHGKDIEITEKLFHASFTASKDIGNIETLAALAEEVGLNKEKALEVLKDKQTYASEVKSDIEEASTVGVTGVPYFVFDRKYTLSGAQQTDTILQTLNKMLEE